MHNSTSSAAANLEIVVTLYYEEIVVLVAVTRLRHLDTASKRVCLDLVLATRMTVAL